MPRSILLLILVRIRNLSRINSDANATFGRIRPFSPHLKDPTFAFPTRAFHNGAMRDKMTARKLATAALLCREGRNYRARGFAVAFKRRDLRGERSETRIVGDSTGLDAPGGCSLCATHGIFDSAVMTKSFDI